MGIVERLREQANVAENWLQRPQAVMADTMTEAAATIEALRAELAARDAEIAAWLTKKADRALTGAEQFYCDQVAAAIAAYLAAMEAEGWPSCDEVRAALIAIDREDDELYHLEDLKAFARAMIAARPQIGGEA